MSADSGLAAPGSSTYSSNTMHVGDGTWDKTRDDFLLPNIQGLNFATMQYNGMGNRFRDLPEYHTLILGHGILAAITFLGIVPAAILIARFYHRDPFFALRVHITLQIFTIILSTVILILGYFAVGPERSLTNPHHGIGVAIYVLVLLQAIGGALVHKIEKGKQRYYIPVKLMLHQWIGRAIALLAMAQIPIGLTLYGSPKYLFVLYALVMFGYLVYYFILTHRKYKRAAGVYDGRGSYVSGRTDLTDENGRPKHSSRLGAWTGAAAGAAAGAVGIAALRRRFSGRKGQTYDDDPSMVGGHSRVDSASYLTGGEKYSDDGQGRDHTWRNRILGGAAGIGAVAAAKKFFGGRNKQRDDYNSDVGAYRPPLGGPVTSSTMNVNRMDGYHGPTETDEERWRRVEEGEAMQQAAANSQSDFRPPGRRQDSVGDYSSEGGGHHGGGGALAGGLAGIAGAVGLGGWLERRRSKKEQDRINAQRQQELEEERLYRTNEQQPLYPGNNVPRPGGGVRFDTNLPGNGPNSRLGGSGPGIPGQPTPTNPYGPQPPLVNIPPPPTSGHARAGGLQSDTGNSNLAPPPPHHQSNPSSLGSGALTPDGQQRGRPYNPNIPPPPMGGSQLRQQSQQPPIPIPQAPPPVASPPRMGPAGRRGSNTTNPSSFSSLPGTGSPQGQGRSYVQGQSQGQGQGHGDEQSPAVSVRVKQHPDGRHVTVQRLSSEEAARRRRMSQGQGQGQGPQSRRGSSADRMMSGGLAPSAVTSGGGPGSAVNVSSPLRSPPYPRYGGPPGAAAAPSAQGQGQGQGQSATLAPAPSSPDAAPSYTRLPPTSTGLVGQGNEMHMPPTPQAQQAQPQPGGQGLSASEYENNRRRRRAQRMRDDAARSGAGSASGGNGGGSVEFN